MIGPMIKKRPTELLTFNQILISKSYEEFNLVFLLEYENTASDSGKEQSVSNTPLKIRASKIST